MSTTSQATGSWMLDSSTFIHSCIAGQTRLLIKLRSPLAFPEYVFRVELGSTAHDDTRQAAQQCVSNNQISIKSLSLEELALLASLNAPRRAGIGELACVLIAHRERGVVLCDDEKCKSWIRANLNPVVWECIEEVLLEAAEKYHLSEFDLAEIQKTLASQRYLCRYDLRTEHLRRELSRRSQAGTQDT